MPLGHRARKRFGQNFLRDPGIIDRMVRAVDPRPGQHLVEIGPGLGAFTAPLLERIGEMDAVELDRDVIGKLEQVTAGLGTLRVHQGDALRYDFAALAAERPLRVVGNLPYNISTPLIFHLLEAAERIEDMHFTLQKEVVERMAAGAGSEAYGRLSVMVQYHCRVEALFTIPPQAFTPVPKVDSAFVRLVPHPQRPVQVHDVAMLEQVTLQAFGQRRKTLRNSLKGLLSEEAIAAVGVDPGERPERLDLQAFARLADAAAQL